MLTPLEIENKKFSKQMVNGYSVDEVDEFLDTVTIEYEKLYKEVSEQRGKIEDLEMNISHYKNIEGTLQNTLLMAQKTADEVKNVAKSQAEQILKDAEMVARESVEELKREKSKTEVELTEIQKQFDIYKAKMEALLISQLELLKDMNNN